MKAINNKLNFICVMLMLVAAMQATYFVNDIMVEYDKFMYEQNSIDLNRLDELLEEFDPEVG